MDQRTKTTPFGMGMRIERGTDVRWVRWLYPMTRSDSPGGLATTHSLQWRTMVTENKEPTTWMMAGFSRGPSARKRALLNRCFEFYKTRRTHLTSGLEAPSGSRVAQPTIPLISVCILYWSGLKTRRHVPITRIDSEKQTSRCAS